MTTLFTADTHFGHAEVIPYFRRPFRNLGEMTRTIIANWNRVVKPADLVYFLGDLGMGDGLLDIFNQLHGYKILILGNHDTEKIINFPWMDVSKELLVTVQDQDIWLSHHPQPSWPNKEKGTWHFYAHVHGRGRLNGLSIDVGLDCWKFYPITLEQIKRRFLTYRRF
jgi:calcineurin-like phosphoesterase family protein